MGYVNALVIENGILNELPTAILTQDHIIKADPSLLARIAGESPSQAIRRDKDKGELEVLEKALRTLRSYNAGRRA